MEASKVDMFIMSSKDFFPAEKIVVLRERLLAADDSKLSAISAVSLKSPTTYLVVSIFLGELGVDRFMLGDIGMGILKLFSCGFCGILWILDIIKISDRVKEKNFQDINMLLQ